jgi:hypothetical protein
VFFSGKSTHRRGGVPEVCATLLSPEICIPYGHPCQSVGLTFYLNYNPEYNWDGMVVHVTEDKGLSWVKLEVVHSTQIN